MHKLTSLTALKYSLPLDVIDILVIARAYHLVNIRIVYKKENAE